MTFRNIFFILLLISGSAQAKIYKWVDDNGETHYTATPPPPKKSTKIIEKSMKSKAYVIDDISINIPNGFKGPTKNNMEEMSIAGFAFPHSADWSTLLQITTWDSGETFPEMAIDDLKAGSKKYLLEFIGGIEKRRTNFKQDQVKFVEISEHPVAKVSWSGMAKGKKVHGVMYAFIFNSKIYSFHTQDLLSANKKYTNLAIKAFESVQLKR